MRKIKIATLVLLCIVTAGLCGIFAYGMTGHNIYRIGLGRGDAYRNDGSMHLVLDEEVSLDGIDNISIQYDMNSNDIYIYENAGNFLTVKEYNMLELAKDEVSTIRTADDSLEVIGKKRNSHIGFQFFSVGPTGGYVEIGLPSAYTGMLSLASSSGDIKAQMDIILEKDFKAQTSSGDISIPNVKAATASINSSSGNVKIETVSTDSGQIKGDLTIKTTSGDIYSGHLVGNIVLGSSSGDITVKQLTGETDIRSNSGFVKSETITGDTQITTISGDIAVQCIDGSAKVEASSGEVRIGAGSGERTVKTNSGDILLEDMNGVWNVEATSGTVWIKASKGNGEIETASGDITLEIGELTGDLNINSTSGFAKVKLSPDSSFDFSAKTSSGDIDTFFDEDLSFSKKGNSAQGTYGDGNIIQRIQIETTSGDVRVLKKG